MHDHVAGGLRGEGDVGQVRLGHEGVAVVAVGLGPGPDVERPEAACGRHHEVPAVTCGVEPVEAVQVDLGKGLAVRGPHDGDAAVVGEGQPGFRTGSFGGLCAVVVLGVLVRHGGRRGGGAIVIRALGLATSRHEQADSE